MNTSGISRRLITTLEPEDVPYKDVTYVHLDVHSDKERAQFHCFQSALDPIFAWNESKYGSFDAFQRQKWIIHSLHFGEYCKDCRYVIGEDPPPGELANFRF